MPRFTEYFQLNLSQHQVDFIDISNEYDMPVYVDPYAIEIRNDVWAAQASEYIRVFFKEVLQALKDKDDMRAVNLMSHLNEPKETFLGVSKEVPKGRGVGRVQSMQLIKAIQGSKAYQTGLLTDLSEMALYVEGIDRDKISDLTTNIIRSLLVEYTQEQCRLYNLPVKKYLGPAMWDIELCNWVAREVELPFIDSDPIMLVPKYIVRRKLSLDSQEFYNKQITDFLVAESYKAASSLVQTVKGKKPKEEKVLKKDVRAKNPKSKPFIVDTVLAHPELLDFLKEAAKKQNAMMVFDENDPSLSTVCTSLASMYEKIPAGDKHANAYHELAMGSLMALFYPDLIQPRKEWPINQGRKRIDIVFTNAANSGFFAQRRDDRKVNANVVIVECKNYSTDIANPEIDQLIGRFDENKGKFGIITCREVDDLKRLKQRCLDASVRAQGYILVLTDKDMVEMLTAKAAFQDKQVESILYKKYRELLE